MKKAEKVDDFFVHGTEDNVRLSELDDAIIGACYFTKKYVYSVVGCIEILMEKHKFTDMEAADYFDSNYAGLFVGNDAPILVEDFMLSKYTKDDF